MSSKTKSDTKKELTEDEVGYDNSDYDSDNDDEIESLVDSINLEDDEDDDLASGKEDYGSDEDIVIEKTKPQIPVASSNSLPASNPNLLVQDPLVYDSDDDDDDDDGESYLQKFNTDLNKEYVVESHPECVHHNYEEIKGLSNVVRDIDNNIIDDLHKTLPYLTKYEKTRVLGSACKTNQFWCKGFCKSTRKCY